jgi:hypothetical protein
MSKNQPFFAHLGDKKTQFRADDKFRFRKSRRDKIESNLQSQMYKNRLLIRGVPRLAGQQNSADRKRRQQYLTNL